MNECECVSINLLYQNRWLVKGPSRPVYDLVQHFNFSNDENVSYNSEINFPRSHSTKKKKKELEKEYMSSGLLPSAVDKMKYQNV